MPSPRKVKRADTTATVEVDESDFDAETQISLDEIETCQNALDTLGDQVCDEVIAVGRKYLMLMKSHLDKRADFIAKVPHFWSTAFANIPKLSSLLEDNEEFLTHLTKIEVDEDRLTGYRIDFYFDENPYFENRVLSKVFNLVESMSSSIPIQWKGGIRIDENKSNNQVRANKRKLEKVTFFTWYNDHSDPISDDVAMIIKDELWRDPLNYFLLPDGSLTDTGSKVESSDDD